MTARLHVPELSDAIYVTPGFTPELPPQLRSVFAGLPSAPSVARVNADPFDPRIRDVPAASVPITQANQENAVPLAAQPMQAPRIGMEM